MLRVTAGAHRIEGRDEEARACEAGAQAIEELESLPSPLQRVRRQPALGAERQKLGLPAVTPTRVDDFYVDWDAFWNVDRPDHDWLLEPILARGRGHSIWAAKKTGKSLVALWMAAELATRGDVLVIYLDYEMTDDDLLDRLTDMGYGPDTDLSRLRYAVLPSLPPLDQPEGGDALLERVEREQKTHPGLHVVVIIDTTSRALVGDENSADTIRAFYQYTGIRLKQHGVTWARLDHAGKDEDRGQRGSSAKGDDVDIVWHLRSADNGYTLTCDAARMSWVPERVALVRHDEPLRFSVAPPSWPKGTLACADMLDGLRVPIEVTKRQAADTLREHGKRSSNAVIAAAVKYRKGQR
jgi:hypothetical protein